MGRIPKQLNNSDSTLAPGYGLAEITLIFWTVKHMLPPTSTMISPFCQHLIIIFYLCGCLKKSFRAVTVYVKSLCYNCPENMKYAIRNPKSEMGGPYMLNSSVIIPACHE